MRLFPLIVITFYVYTCYPQRDKSFSYVPVFIWTFIKILLKFQILTFSSPDEESFADTEEDFDVGDDFIPLDNRYGILTSIWKLCFVSFKDNWHHIKLCFFSSQMSYSVCFIKTLKKLGTCIYLEISKFWHCHATEC